MWSNTCLQYSIPEGDKALQKCRTQNNCLGVTTGTYNLFACSDVPDPTGTYICKDQCCYFHQLERKNVCLAPQAIGLVKDQYKPLCDAASRDLYKQIQDLRKQLEQKKNKEFILALCGIVLSGLAFLITIPFLIIKICQFRLRHRAHRLAEVVQNNDTRTPEIRTMAQREQQIN